MPLRLVALLALALSAARCAAPTPAAPVVPLVAAADLVALLPAAVDSFAVSADTLYRGYFADSALAAAGPVAVVTASRIYGPGFGRASLSLTSASDAARYEALLAAQGLAPAADSTVAADATLARATAAGWRAFTGPMGLTLLDADGRAVEARAMDPALMRRALAAVDLGALAALAPRATTVDAVFTRTE